MPNMAPRAILEPKNCQSWLKNDHKTATFQNMAQIMILMAPMKPGRGVYWQSTPHMIYENFDFTRFSPGGPGAQGAKMRFGQSMGMPHIKMAVWKRRFTYYHFQVSKTKNEATRAKNMQKKVKNCTFWYYSGQFSQSMGPVGADLGRLGVLRIYWGGRTQYLEN